MIPACDCLTACILLQPVAGFESEDGSAVASASSIPPSEMYKGVSIEVCMYV